MARLTGNASVDMTLGYRWKLFGSNLVYFCCHGLCSRAIINAGMEDWEQHSVNISGFIMCDKILGALIQPRIYPKACNYDRILLFLTAHSACFSLY